MADATISQQCSCAHCYNVHYSHGVCRTHYQTMKVTGEIKVGHYSGGLTLAQRLDAKSEANIATGCRLWTATKNNKGYGALRFNGRLQLAHRLAYELANGAVAADMFICHRCDTPACVNPDHLFAALEQGNSDDKLEKERQARGVSHGMSRLNADQVIAIRADTRRNRPIGDDYGISPGCVSMIKHRKRWAHIR